MESPLGPTLANLFLAQIESMPQQDVFLPVQCSAYADDILCVYN